jgi:uncharacterized protein (DUF1501 family)
MAVPVFLARSATAVAGDRKTAASGRILVVVQLEGGNDGLNTVVPYRDDEYRKHRPALQVGDKESVRVDDHVALHPALGDFAKLLERQRLAIVQGVGYPNPNRSHFESMAIWNTGRLDADKATPGWLARAIDRAAHSVIVEGDAPAIHIHDELPPARAVEGGRQVIPSIARLEQFQRRLGVPQSTDSAMQAAALDRLARRSQSEAGSLLQFVERCGLVTYASSARLEAVRRRKPDGASAYPQDFGLARGLERIAQMIKAGLTTSIYYTQLDGFDTHAGQLTRHPQLLRELGHSVRSFLDDMEKAGEADRVLVLVFSEFGRRLAENANGGTDHGTAAPVFLLGAPVQAGLHGKYPDLTNLVDDDPTHSTDFRSVYATVLERWLGVSAWEVLGIEFEPLPLLRAL